MVATMIDPGGQQVRLALQHLVDGQFHTIDRSPGTAINRQSFFFPHQCILDRHERSDRACKIDVTDYDFLAVLKNKLKVES